MISIINKGPTSKDEAYDPGGDRKYQIKINHTLIAEFTHYRRDGLAVCLGKAAAAVMINEPCGNKACEEHNPSNQDGSCCNLFFLVNKQQCRLINLDKVLAAAIKTLNDNLHLCDGDVCTLKELRDVVAQIRPYWCQAVKDG